MSGCVAPLPTPKLSSAEPEKSALTIRAALLFVFGYAPLLSLFFLNLWSRPHYQFFPLALFGAFLLGWIRLQGVERPLRGGHRMLSLLFLSASFVLLALATLFWSPWFGGLATLVGLAGGIWMTGGSRLFRALVPALVLVSSIIPPPLALDTRFAEHLRTLAINWSSHLLDLLAVTHSRSGNVIELPGQKLLVEEACSGINSVLVTMACCLFYMLWRRRSILRTVLCVVSSVSFVLLGNLFRISFGAWLKFRYNIEILSGWKHQLCGIILFSAYLVLIFSLDKWLDFLTSPVRVKKSKPISGSQPAPPPAATAGHSPLITPKWTTAAACLFALLGLAGLGLGWSYHQRNKSAPAIAKSTLKDAPNFTMPDRLGDWVRLNSQSPQLQKVETLGVFSQIWHYQNKDIVAALALDYPFAGYHDVTLCYTLRGWRALSSHAAYSKG